MESEVKLGDVGDVDFTFASGKVKVELKVELPGGGASAGAFAQIDAGVLADKLFAAIEAKSPAGVVAIEEAVKSIVKSAIVAASS